MNGDEVRAKVWLITGAGRGIGRALAEAVLVTGDHVVATVRRADALDDLVAAHPDRLLPMILDVRDRERSIAVIDEAVHRFGRLDVLVNNAGYGLVGAAEEVSEAEARAILDTNFLGALWTTQAALAHMRAQGDGHIVQISTVGGVGAMAFLGMYNAGKWALEGFSEALAAEVAPFGVKVTIAELDGFATDWGSASMQFAEPLRAYDDGRLAVLGTADVPWDTTAADDSTEAPPRVAAEAIVAHVRSGDDRLRLLVGENSPTYVALALDARRRDYGRDPRFTWPA